MIGHRFVADIKADRLPKDVFDHYLVFEGAFVETAISIFAYAAAKAGKMAQKRWLIAVLDALANQQISFFERTFAARGIDPASYDTNRPEVAAFREGMLAIARDGSYLDTVAAMFAAEWMYWSWSRAAAACTIRDPLLREWIDLHAHDDFKEQALWLKSELDAAGEYLDANERVRLSAIFSSAQELEIAFHQAPYLSRPEQKG